MRCPQVPRILNCPSLLVLLLAFGLFAADEVSALPGVGGLAKKAKEKAAKAAGMAPEETVNKETVVFDGVVVELTGERLERIVATFKAAQAASAGRPALVEKLNKAQDERNKLMEKQGEAIQEIRRKRDDVEACRHDGLLETTNRKMEEYSQKALTDPTIREKFTKIAQQHNAAAMSGDSAAIKSAQDEIAAVVLPTREDTLDVYKKCGPLPPPLPSEVKRDDLDRQVASLFEQIRKIDEKVSEAQAAQGGMSREQFGMATERIQMYLDWRQSKSYSKSATRGFTSEEIEALEKYLEKLLAAMG
jgi:hypothetical protein